MVSQRNAAAGLDLVSLVRNVALEPLLTGPLLLALTKGPEPLRERLLRLFSASPYNPRIARVLRTLKWLLALGVARRVNMALNAWAMNHWRWRREGAAWDWWREVAIVTGGCGGIGKLVVKGLASNGLKVVVLDVQEMPEDLKHHPQIVYYHCDITSPSSVSETANTIRDSHGHPSVLINNAGIAEAHTILDTSDEYLHKLFGVNLLSHFTLIREFLPTMMANKKGHIVSVASMASFLSGANIVDYCATKAGVLALHEGESSYLPLSVVQPEPSHGINPIELIVALGLNQELKHRYGPSGRTIQTSVIHPMWAQTPLIKTWEASLNKQATPILTAQTVADAIVKQVMSGRGGQVIVPPSAGTFAGIRGWPNWLQEYLRDQLASLTVRS